MIKRLFDIVFSFFGIIILLPPLLIISFLIIFDSRGGIFYFQQRVGKYNKDFRLIKFRTMKPDSEKTGLLTVGNNDSRITKVGAFLRKYKLDELPQLFNVLIGDMSLVGPRPEVRKYVDMYTAEQMKVLSVKPGMTDHASIEYADENELLAKQTDPESFYVEEVIPAKLKINLAYVSDHGLMSDVKIILKTFFRILRK